MSTETLQVRKSRDFGEALGFFFSFIWQNLGLLLKSMIVISGPPFAFAVIGVVAIAAEAESHRGRAEPLALLLMFVCGLMVLAGLVLMVGVMHCIVWLRADDSEEEFTVGDVWERVRGNLGVITGTTLVYVLAVVGGLIFCYIPGIYLAILLSPILMVRLQEGLSLGESFSRCSRLMKNNWWNNFGLHFVLNIALSMVGFILVIPGFVAMMVSGATMGSRGYGGGYDPDMTAAMVISIALMVLGYAGSFLLRSMSAVLSALQYYNLAEKHEGWGMMQTLDSIGKSSDDPAAGKAPGSW